MAPWGNRDRNASFRGRRVRDRARRRRALRMIIALILGGGLLIGIWYGTRAESITITTVDVFGGKTIDVQKVEQKVQAILEGSYFWLIPKRFSYTYPHDAIIEAVTRLPRVENATVVRTSSTSLSITLTEYTPYALWCDYVPSLDIPSPCLFISEDGFAFAQAPSLRGATFLRYMTESRTPEVGASLADPESMQATNEFTRALMQRHGRSVSAIIETKDGDVRYRVDGGGELLVGKDADMQEVFENLDAVLLSKEFKHIASGDFVYIDLRFGNKVFVKEFPTEAAATSTSGMPEMPTIEHSP